MLCDKIIIIDNGKILASDKPSNLVREMRAAGRVTVELKGPADVAGKALNKLDSIKKVSHEISSDGWQHFSILVDSGTDARERIHQLCVQRDWPVRSLYRHDATLEDVFVELTRKD